MVWLLPVGAQADSGDAAEQVAARASKVSDTYCAKVAGLFDESAAAQAISEVSAVWAEVALVHEATGATWLLYWRGVLAQCIDQDERAADALVKFVESNPTAGGLAAMVRDARKRLRRLRPEYVPPKPPKTERSPPTPEQRARSGRIAAGVLLALGAAGAGVGSGLGFTDLSVTRTTAWTLRHTTAEADALIAQGDGQMAAAVGLAVGAGAAMVASIAAFARNGAVEAEVAVLVVPLADGVAITVGGGW